ncbi:MAG: patatin-like phospholipase family protein [Myxococcota bacterium]
MAQGNPEVAFSLSGGGSLGAVQVGMVKALYERGIAPDLLVGTSAGAINAGFLASRPPSVDTAQELEDIWLSLRRADVFPVQAVRGLLGFVGRRPYLVPNTGLRTLLRQHLGLSRLEDARIPLTVIATDLLSGREVELSEGPAQEAILASAAIPGVFPPVPWERMELIDGAISNNTPLSPALASGAQRIYVLPTGSACGLTEAPQSAIGVLMHSVGLLVMQRLIREIDRFADSRELIVLPPPCPLHTQAVDFSDSAELIRRGRADTHRYLDALDAGRVEAPLRLSMHDHLAPQI